MNKNLIILSILVIIALAIAIFSIVTDCPVIIFLPCGKGYGLIGSTPYLLVAAIICFFSFKIRKLSNIQKLRIGRK